VRTQLFETREIVAQLDKAQEERALTDDELALRSGLKRQSLGLASLARTIARHRSRIRFLEDGDANTNFFIYRRATGVGKTTFLQYTMRGSGSRLMKPSQN